MTVKVEHDESTNTYNLTADIEGVPIVFASVPGDTVRGRIDAVHAAEEGAGGGGGGGTPASTRSGGGFDASDYTDNGDGTYTRTSDGQRGRFTPSGFTSTE